jgi:hypothetical protein
MGACGTTCWWRCCDVVALACSGCRCFWSRPSQAAARSAGLPLPCTCAGSSARAMAANTCMHTSASSSALRTQHAVAQRQQQQVSARGAGGSAISACRPRSVWRSMRDRRRCAHLCAALGGMP